MFKSEAKKPKARENHFFIGNYSLLQDVYLLLLLSCVRTMVVVITTFIFLLADLLDGEHRWPGPVVVPEDGSLTKHGWLRPEVWGAGAGAGVVTVDGSLVVLPVPEHQVDTVARLGGNQLTGQAGLPS